MAKKSKKKERLPEIEVQGGEQVEMEEDLISEEDLVEDIAPAAASNFDLDGIESRIVDIDEQPLYLKALFYGDQGTGKTTTAATFPGVLFLDCNEKGTMSIRGSGHKVILIERWEDLEAAYWYLATRKHPFKTVVIDTATQAVDLGMARVLELDGHEGLPIKKHWGQLTQLAKATFINFRNLPMHVVFLAQLKRLDEDELSDDESYTKVPMISPAIRASLGGAVDVIGYTFIKEVTETDKKGREKVSYSYRMRIGPSSTILTKIRARKGVSYPAVLKDPSFAKIMEIITKGV